MKKGDEFYREVEMMGEEALVVVRVVDYPMGAAATVVVRGPDGELAGAKQVMVSEITERLDPMFGDLTAEPSAEQQAFKGRVTPAMQVYFN